MFFANLAKISGLDAGANSLKKLIFMYVNVKIHFLGRGLIPKPREFQGLLMT